MLDELKEGRVQLDSYSDSNSKTCPVLNIAAFIGVLGLYEYMPQ